MHTDRKRNSLIKPGDCILYWNTFHTVISISEVSTHPTVKKECVTLNFADRPSMTAFLDDYSIVSKPN